MLKRSVVVFVLLAVVLQGNGRKQERRCGVRPLISKRIVGGQESTANSWPWMVALMFNGTQFCAGSLINSKWIVTGAHCFHDSYSSTKPKLWKAMLGEHRLKEKDQFEQIRKVTKIILHPKYKSMFMEGILDTPPDYDIALVKLKTPIQIDNYASPICLLRPGVSFPAGKECYIAGWGHTEFKGTQPPALREAKTKIVPTKECNKNESFAGKIHERSFCAGFKKGGVDTCQYDSGGPLNCQENGQYYLAGIVSWGHGCASPHKYGVYSNMAVLTSWVKTTIKKQKAMDTPVNPFL